MHLVHRMYVVDGLMMQKILWNFVILLLSQRCQEQGIIVLILFGVNILILFLETINRCYNKYILLVAANKDGVPGTNKENAMHNPAYNISAALTYATQLVNVIAYYVNVRLPYKLACGYVLWLCIVHYLHTFVY